MKLWKKILAVIAGLLLLVVWASFCFLLLLSIITSDDYEPEPYEHYSPPAGFECFTGYNDDYYVYAIDTLYGFTIRAQVLQHNPDDYCDVYYYYSGPVTKYVIEHKSGWKKTYTTRGIAVNNAKYYKFIGTGHPRDTIMPLDFELEIKVDKGEFNLSELENRSFFFFDVDFSGRPSLVIRDTEQGDPYYDVYSCSDDTVSLHSVLPQVKVAYGHYFRGYGTNFDYTKKEIVMPSMAPGSCSDYGECIRDYYAIDKQDNKLKLMRTEKKSYDYSDN